MPTTDWPGSVVGQALAHDSAALHATGEAHYVDDMAEPAGLLHAAIGISPVAHGRIIAFDRDPIQNADGVVTLITAGDIPGTNSCAATSSDEPILADETVEFFGQPVFAVAAGTIDQARDAVRIDCAHYEAMEAILDVPTARDQESYMLPSRTLSQGDPEAAISGADHILQGVVAVGGQEHFYLEGQIAMAVPLEGEQIRIYSSTQHPGQVQQVVARALGIADNNVIVECRRMGGGFGGKESQAALFAGIAALLAQRSGQAVKLRLDRDDDILITGKRHDFCIGYRVGFNDQGCILGVEFELESRCGMTADLSASVNDRAMLHCDNGYYLEHIRIVSHRYKTNTQSNTAFRGFGGPQGMFGIEYVIDEIARYLRCDPLAVRRINFYGSEDRNRTPYGQIIKDNQLHEIVDDLVDWADYYQRKQAIQAFNATNPVLRRGIALTPVKFGIAFTSTHLNQASALLNVYTDGSVQLNHGGTEMGQGLFIKIAQVVAEELQIDIDRIQMMAADTSKIPNASATAASSGADLNAKAAQIAARTIRQRLIPVAAKMLSVAEDKVVFKAGRVCAGGQTLAFADVVRCAWMERVSLSATGFYSTPELHFDSENMTGHPFYYYAYGAAISEVVVDTLTGEQRVLRVDIVHDCGQSLNPAIDKGQIEGGFVQGMGWLTTEELWWDADGQLRTYSPSTYKIPVCADVPEAFNVRLLPSGRNRQPSIYRSKAVGEPPLMLALSVFFAIKDAVASIGSGHCPRLDAPASPQTVLAALDAMGTTP